MSALVLLLLAVSFVAWGVPVHVWPTRGTRAAVCALLQLATGVVYSVAG